MPRRAHGSRPPRARSHEAEPARPPVARSNDEGHDQERGAPVAMAAAGLADRHDRGELALAQHPGAGDPQPGGQIRRRSRQRPAHRLALSPGARGGAAGVRSVVRPFRAPAGRAGWTCACDRRQHRRHLRRQHRGSHRRARRAIARRLDRTNHRTRDHPRSIRPRTRGLHDRAGHLGGGAHADGRAAHRRHSRHIVRLGRDLRLHRRC